MAFFKCEKEFLVVKELQQDAPMKEQLEITLKLFSLKMMFLESLVMKNGERISERRF